MFDSSSFSEQMRSSGTFGRSFSAASAASLAASIASGCEPTFLCTASRRRCASAEIERIDFLRSRRIRLPDLWLFRCDEPQRLWLTLPVADTLNRFLIPLCVLSLGMYRSDPYPSTPRYSMGSLGDNAIHRQKAFESNTLSNSTGSSRTPFLQQSKKPARTLLKKLGRPETTIPGDTLKRTRRGALKPSFDRAASSR